MRELIPRIAAAVAIVLIGLSALLGDALSKPPAGHPDRLIILSTTDVRGKTSPCG